MVNCLPVVLDVTFGALSDATRREMIQRLAQGERTISELAERFEMSLPAISKHVRILEKAGLLVRQKDGRIHRCRLQPQPLEEATQWIEQHRVFWEKNLDSLANFLEKTKNKGETHAHTNRKQKP
jgi:DNA-binding transcriptional ArsR family regulator